MTPEELQKYIEGFIFSGKDPYIISKELTEYVLSLLEEKTLKKNKRIEKISSWIDEWLEIFPQGIKSGGKLIRSDKVICLNKMVTFCKNYPEFTKDDIINATKKYINEQEKKDYAYTVVAANFISHREKGSELAARCRDWIITTDKEILVDSEEKSGFFL